MNIPPSVIQAKALEAFHAISLSSAVTQIGFHGRCGWKVGEDKLHFHHVTCVVAGTPSGLKCAQSAS